MLMDTATSPGSAMKKRITSWGVDNHEMTRPKKKVRVKIEDDPIRETLIIAEVKWAHRKQNVKEESPELMPEDDAMLAAFAASVDDSCMQGTLGPVRPVKVEGKDIELVNVEEDTAEILSSLEDEALPMLKIRPPDVANPLTHTQSAKSLTLDKKSVAGYLRAFQFKLEGLEGIPGLEPYLAPFLDKKQGKRHKSKKSFKSNPHSDEPNDSSCFENPNQPKGMRPSPPKIPNKSPEVEWSRKAGENFLRGIMSYPLSEAQLKVVRLFAAQTTIVFTELLDLEQVLKLIALRVQVTVPYYGRCLFSNLRNVIFTSTFRLQLIQSRHADPDIFDPKTSKVRPDAVPHRMSILLYWLADNYNICIHYPSAGDKETSIRDWAMRLPQDEGWSEEAAHVAAEESWIALDTLGCMFSPASLKGLVRLSLHSVQAGATFHLDTPTTLVVRFAPRSKSHSVGWQDTIDSISSMVMVCARARSGSVTFHTIEHLAVSRPFGPIITPEQKKSRYELMGRLHQTLIKECGIAQPALDQARKRLRDGDTLRISVDCRICGKDCEEWDCQEKIDNEGYSSI